MEKYSTHAERQRRPSLHQQPFQPPTIDHKENPINHKQNNLPALIGPNVLPIFRAAL